MGPPNKGGPDTHTHALTTTLNSVTLLGDAIKASSDSLLDCFVADFVVGEFLSSGNCP